MVSGLSVVGLGKLGLPLAAVLAKHYKVIGIDKTQLLPPKIKEKDLDKLLSANWKNLTYSLFYDKLGDLTFVIVPTPSLSDDKFTSEYVENVLKNIYKKQTVVIVSTVMPGETDKLQSKYPHLELIYSPTFIALGSVIENLTNPDFILIGSNSKKGVSKLKEVYKKICTKPKFIVLKPIEAEIAKLAINCYITMKITFANQIGNLCYRVGIKPDRILNAVGSDSRIGNKYLRAGLGYGGCCFPRDNLALTAFCREYDYSPMLFSCVDVLNSLQIPEYINRIMELKPKSVGFKSLSFKEGTENTERSQLLEIYEELKRRGLKVKLGKGEVNLDWWGICE